MMPTPQAAGVAGSLSELELLHVLAVGAGQEEAFLRLVRDAERYRWIRTQTWRDGQMAVVADPRLALGCDYLSHSRLDDRIDLAQRLLAERHRKR